ncbi:MAG: hypothetical protein JNM70_12815 [Anaerolineae bacterium]|nr:hypothetical protein [Anaerolineae bacterium]
MPGFKLISMEIIRALNKVPGEMGEPGWRFVEAAKGIQIDAHDLDVMQEAIEAWCERAALGSTMGGRSWR